MRHCSPTAVQFGGTEGNARLTKGNALVLLVLLAAEGATIPFIGGHLTWHIFLGLALIPPVLLKLGSTTWRFARYYLKAPEYLEKGPPHPLMRLLVAPLTVASTAGLFGTGALLMILHPQRGILLGLHKASFIVWLGAMGLHVLGHVLELPGFLRTALGQRHSGARLRQLAIAGALVVGVMLAIVALPAAHTWEHWASQHHSREGRDASAAKPSPATRLSAQRVTVASSPAGRLLGLPDIAGGPVPGYVLIADRNNDRLLIVSPSKRVVWTFPRPGDVRPGQSFHDPDDAFFTPGYKAISINEEFNETVSLVDVRTHRIGWSFGHAGTAGSAFGYLSNPDDAYLLPNGLVMVADIKNCRVLFINRAKRVVREIGHAGSCTHDPPVGLSSPNGATPLPDGGVLVTEIGGWVDRIDAAGKLVYSLRTPTTYPSDAQLLPNGNILVAGFNSPGRVDELTPSGRVVWTYGPPSGPGALDRPSLAVRWPNGMIAVTDDWHHRIVVIDPKTKRIVWSYGHDGSPGKGPGYLSKPDGLDLLPAARLTAPELRSSHLPKPTALSVGRVGEIPAALSRASAVMLPNGNLVVAGGIVGASSTDQILIGPPSRLQLRGHLPAAGHDAAAVLQGRAVYVFGGGQSVSTNTVVRIDPSRGTALLSAPLDEALSDLGAVVIGSRVYLVGGYTGTRYASAVLRYDGRAHTSTVARLPAGIRYAGVSALDGKIYVAGGVTTAGETDAVLAVDPVTGAVRHIAKLPAPNAYAPLVSWHGALYSIGGKTGAGAAVASIVRIDPATGRTRVVGRLPEKLAEPAAVASAGEIVVVGGEGSRAVFSVRLR